MMHDGFEVELDGEGQEGPELVQSISRASEIDDCDKVCALARVD